jgi:hypothetical protein
MRRVASSAPVTVRSNRSYYYRNRNLQFWDYYYIFFLFLEISQCYTCDGMEWNGHTTVHLLVLGNVMLELHFQELKITLFYYYIILGK